MKYWLTPFVISPLLIIAACGVAPLKTPAATADARTTSSPIVQANTEAMATTAPETVPEPTEEAGSTREPELVDWLTVEGKTADNLPYRGNPDAPVTMIDYSDFL